MGSQSQVERKDAGEHPDPGEIWAHGSLSEIVLSSLAGDIAEENGMTWTMMITCETSCAGVVVIPSGDEAAGNAVVGYIAYGTYTGTFSAVDALLGDNLKLAVVNHPAVEVFTDDVGEKPRGSAL